MDKNSERKQIMSDIDIAMSDYGLSIRSSIESRGKPPANLYQTALWNETFTTIKFKRPESETYEAYRIG